ncbi:hypothetical protein KAR48_00100 [bacterium]|nr:hypothetical protein [bacterium]
MARLNARVNSFSMNYRTLIIAIIVLMSALLLGYVATRAYYMDFTHDESLSYVNSVSGSAADNMMLTYRSANNHPVNTWGMYFCSKLLGVSEFTLRLPNILAYGLYLLATFMVVRRIKSPFYLLTAFVLLNLHPLLIDLFSVARGYGISLAFMMTSLWFYMDSSYSRKRHLFQFFAFLSIVFATFSVFANFTFLYFLMFICLFYCILYIQKNIDLNFRSIKSIKTIFNDTVFVSLFAFMLWTAVFVIFFVGRRLVDFHLSHQLTAGGDVGFWQDTISALFNYSLPAFYNNAPWAGHHIQMAWVAPLTIIISMLIVAIGVYVLTRILIFDKSKNGAQHFALPATMIVMLTIIINGVFYLAGQNFPNCRTGVLFIPGFGLMMIMILLYFIDHQSHKIRISVAISSISIILFLAVNLSLSMNLHQTIWPRDADTKAMMKDLQADYLEHRGEGQVRLGTVLILEPSINYYRLVNDMGWLDPVTRDPLELDYQYFYIIPNRLQGLRTLHKVKIIKTYQRTGNLLLKRVDAVE